jgi:hypothetical protein
MTWRRLGRHWCGPDGSGGGAASRRARGMDPTAVEEAVGEAPALTRRRWMGRGIKEQVLDVRWWW